MKLYVDGCYNTRMSEREEFYPEEKNLGKNCLYWQLEGPIVGCIYPKAELQGRTSCEGMVDTICLLRKDGRKPNSMTENQIRTIMNIPPSFEGNRTLPPGNTE